MTSFRFSCCLRIPIIAAKKFSSATSFSSDSIFAQRNAATNSTPLSRESDQRTQNVRKEFVQNKGLLGDLLLNDPKNLVVEKATIPLRTSRNPLRSLSNGLFVTLSRSDPTENDSVEGRRPNARGPGLVTFGPDLVMEFCKNNDLQLLVRAHVCDGRI